MPSAHLSLTMLHPRYWLLWCGLGLLWLLVQLPHPWQMAIGRRLGRIAMRLLKRRVQIARRNLQLALPELAAAERERLLIANFENVGCAVFETGMAWFWSDRRMRRWMQIEGEELWRKAATNIGIRPMFELPTGLVEAHILDYEGDIYGKTVRVRPVRKIRDEMKFSDIDALKAQITLDAEAAREYFRQHPPSDR